MIDLGGKRVRYLATPHVPHEWEASVFFEETTSTLLCGDLFKGSPPTRAGVHSFLSLRNPVPLRSVSEAGIRFAVD